MNKKENRILILGASGNIGGKIARELIARGETPGVVGRDNARLAPLAGQADRWVGDFGDDDFLREAMREADTLFLTVPDEHLVHPAATALRLGRLLAPGSVTHIVNISNSIVARGGTATRLVAFESELDKLAGIHVKHLRCANFFENLNWGFSTPYRPKLKLPYISSYEVAFVAANYLQHRRFAGHSVEVLLGARDYDMEELAAAAGAVYRQLPYRPENVDFFRPFNEGDFVVEERTSANTSSQLDPRFTLEYFVRHDLAVMA